MGAAVVAIGSVISGAASVVASVVAPIAGAVSAAVAPVVSAIGSVIGAISSTLGSALAPVSSTIGGIADWAVTSIGQTVGGLVDTVANATRPFLESLTKAIGGLAEGVTKATKPILDPIKAGLEAIQARVEAVEDWVTSAFHPSARLDELKAAHPDLWETAEGVESSFIAYLQEDAVISSTEAGLLLMPDVIETINEVATLKVMADLVTGQASVSELLGAVSEGKSFETARAIAELSQSIVTSTIGLMDRVDSEVGILRAGIESFDERFSSELSNTLELQKADLMAVVTPKLNRLGEYHDILDRDIARLFRHIEDEAWFGQMLLRFLG